MAKANQTAAVPLSRDMDALELVSLFQRLTRARGDGTQGLSSTEEQMLQLIGDMFEPLRAVAGGHMRREAVRLCVNRPAIVAAEGRLMAGNAVVLELHRVELSTRKPIPLGESVAVSIASMDRRRWFAFHGRCVQRGNAGRTATILLLPEPSPAPRPAGRQCERDGTRRIRRGHRTAR